MNGDYTTSAVKELIKMHREYNQRHAQEPTQQQIKQAQEAGNAAMDCADDATTNEQAYDAYRAAYAATLAALTERRCTCGAGYLTIPRNHDAQCALQAAAHEAGVTAEWLTPEQVAQLEARTDEQSGIVEHYASHTEGHG